MLHDWLGKPEKRPHRSRAAERFAAIGLSCPLGDVLDLSTSGARVRWGKKPALKVGDSLSLKLSSESQCLRVQATVIWVRRTGLLMGGGELGLKFLGVSKGMAIALVQLGKYGFVTKDAGTAESAADDVSGKSRLDAEEARRQATVSTPSPTPPPQGAERQQEATRRQQPGPAGRVVAEIEVDDLYTSMGVGREATADEIRAAYRVLAKELHPDRNPSADASARFALVSKAYTVLRDPELRARYDVLLNSSKPAPKAA